MFRIKALVDWLSEMMGFFIFKLWSYIWHCRKSEYHYEM